jgi:hypothetical protein
MDELLKKLEGILEAEDLQKLRDSIQNKINEEVETKVALMVEEKTVELEKISEEYVEAEIAKRVEVLEETKKQDLEKLEESLINDLDKFLDTEITSKISEEALLKVAVNETLKPVVEGIKKIFEDNNIAIDVDASATLKEATDKITALELEKSKLIEEKMELLSENETHRKAELIDEKVEGLSDDQKIRVFSMFEEASYKDVESKIDSFIDIVISEEVNINKNKKHGKKIDIVENDDVIVDKKPVINESTETSIGKLAARYF